MCPRPRTDLSWLAQHPVRGSTCQPKELSRNCSRGFSPVHFFYTTKILFHRSGHPQLLPFKRSSLIRLRLSCRKKEICHAYHGPATDIPTRKNQKIGTAHTGYCLAGWHSWQGSRTGTMAAPVTLCSFPVPRFKMCSSTLALEFSDTVFRRSHFHSPPCAVDLRTVPLFSETAPRHVCVDTFSVSFSCLLVLVFTVCIVATHPRSPAWHRRLRKRRQLARRRLRQRCATPADCWRIATHHGSCLPGTMTCSCPVCATVNHDNRRKCTTRDCQHPGGPSVGLGQSQGYEARQSHAHV